MSLVEQHIGLAKSIAFSLARRLPQHVGIDPYDLEGEAMVSLVKAARSYDPERGEAAGWIAYRVRYDLVDWVRQHGTLSREYQKHHKAMRGARAELAEDLGREATHEETAQALGVSIDRYHQLRRDTVAPRRAVDASNDEGMVPALVEQQPDDRATAAFLDVDDRLDVESALLLMRFLPTGHRRALRAHFIDNLDLKTIGKREGYTESRACQVIKAAIAQLRAKAMGSPEPTERERGRAYYEKNAETIRANQRARRKSKKAAKR